ncbi:MAG: protein translocase subunit SecD, partial [Rhodospirillaceae bacterium]|nr:protein translocase subunit SecD [Rhodospirillaceae bacterium]
MGIVVLGLAFAAPNLLDRKSADELPGWLPHEQVNLGLDLQGGSHLLLEVKASVVVRERLESLVDGVRIALRKDRIRYTGLGLRGKTVTFMVRKSSELEKARKLAQGIEDNLEILAEGNRVTVNFTQRAL